MIKTSVSTYFDKDVYPYPQIDDADSNFISECNKEDTAKEIVKRINMHDELVDELEQIKIFLDEIHVMPVNWITKEGAYRHAVVCELLERCK